jgi:hypothetical protein
LVVVNSNFQETSILWQFEDTPRKRVEVNNP